MDSEKSVGCAHNIRLAEIQDFEEIIPIVESSQTFGKEMGREILNEIDHYTRHPEGDEFMTFVLSSGGKVAGFVCIGLGLGEKTYEVYWICVSEMFQGRQIGTKLIQYAEDYISHVGGRIIFIETGTSPYYERARRLYGKLGYQSQAVVKDYFGDGHDKIIYSKRITSQNVFEPMAN